METESAVAVEDLENETIKGSARCDNWCKKHWLIIAIVVLLVIIASIYVITMLYALSVEVLEDVEELCAFYNARCYVPYVAASSWKAAVNECYYNEFGEYSEKGFINSGTPQYVDIEFDCAMRKYAYEYGTEMQPRHGSFVDLFDALQLQVCDETRPSNNNNNTEYPYYSENDNNDNTYCVYYIDPNDGNDLINNGTSSEFAFLTFEKALNATRNISNSTQCVINILEGTLYLTSTIVLTEIDSNLIIQNYNGSQVVVSGGISLEFDGNWTLYEYEQTQWRQYDGYNNVYGITSVGSHVKYLGQEESYEDCLSTVKKRASVDGPFYSLTYAKKSVKNDSKSCFGIRDVSWQPVLEFGYESGRNIGQNIWYNTITNIDETENNMIYGLRTNNKRGINARFPDQNPETSMQYFAWNGWITFPSKTESITFPNANEVVITSENVSSSIEWPLSYPGGGGNFTGFGDSGKFEIGQNGICNASYDDIGLGSWEQPYGFFCKKDNPREEYINGSHHIYYHICPKSIYLNQTFLPNLPEYDNISNNCLIHAYRPFNWYNWIFACGDYDQTTNELAFKKGGFQGTQGSNDTGYWYIENVFEELTMANEYYYNQTTNELYYFHNISSNDNGSAIPPPNTMNFVGTNLKTLFNIQNASNITIRGLTFRDTRYTYLDDNYNALSAGDYGLTRAGAIFLENTQYCELNNNTFTRLDGNGIFLSGYNRYTYIKNNNFEWIGENAMVAWGYTTSPDDILPYGIGPDGRNGDQPRYTFVENNLIREIGIWVKQSAGWNQAQSCQTYLKNNIFFNGPRSAINLNDGFGGDNHIIGNLAFNFCRESGDNGVFNSWDRMPFITKVNEKYVNGSIIPEWNHINNNFFIGNYIAFIAIDNDDGSAYYKTYNNFIVYGGFGIKSDYSGHDNRHYNNTYAYINDWIILLQQAGANDWFVDNNVILSNDCGYGCGANRRAESKYFSYATNMTVGHNSVFVPSGSISDDIMEYVCGLTFEEWQEQGNDIGTTINAIPSVNKIINIAKRTLSNN